MPGLIIDKVGGGDFNNPKNYLHYNYQDLMVLVADAGLERGRKYVIVDYLHKYSIAGANSSGLIRNQETYQYAYGYATFGYYIYDMPVGRQVIVTYLPEGYAGAIQVGDVTTVTANSQNWYFQFANGMHSINGLGFKYYLSRYNTIPEGAEILDDNGKPVMMPGGVINTDVHDGTPYMDMTAEENFAILPEQLLLTAKDSGTFEEEVLSLTYPGDVVKYEIDWTEITNDNYEVIGTRPGFITGRKNESLGIDIGMCWRNAKFRRWQLDLESRTKLLNQHLDVNTTQLGYQGKWLYTAGKRKVTEPQYFYLAQLPEGKLSNLNANAQWSEFDYNPESLANAKDFPIFPLNSERNPHTGHVNGVKIKNIGNTVFQQLPSENTFKLNAEFESIYSSTFVGSANLQDPLGFITRATVLDSLLVGSNDISIDTISVLSFQHITDSIKAQVKRVVFGTMQNGVRLSGVDQPLPVVWWNYLHLTQTILNKVAISGVTPRIYINNCRLIETSIFNYYCPTHPDVYMDSEYSREHFNINGGVFSKVTMRFLNVVDRLVFSNMFFKDSNAARQNSLWLYDITTPSYSRNIKKNDATDALYIEVMDADYNRTFTEISSQAPNPLNDLTATIAADNETPVIGSNVIFTITGANNGNQPATEVQVISLLPDGFTFVSDDGAGSYDPVTGIWTLGNLAAAASSVLNITATVLETGPYQVTAEITGAEAENIPADNTSSITLIPTAV